MEELADLIDELGDIYEIVNVPRLRIIRDRSNPIVYYHETEFKRRFRLTKQTVYQLTGAIEHLLEHPTAKNNALPPVLQVCGCLRLLAGGSFQTLAADLIHVSQPTISRTMTNFLAAILQLRPEIVKFPDDLQSVKRRFFGISGFPGVIGAVDGTHVEIIRPAINQNPDIFRNRKSKITLNVQVVCGPDLAIYSVVSRWPGSTHDSRIFNNSLLKDRLETGNLQHQGLLLGDKGYPCLPYLLTPLRVSQTNQERRYNASHIRTRCAVERSIGVLKKRFPCLQNRLMYQPSKAAKIVIVCIILHNIAIAAKDSDFGPLPPEDDLNRAGNQVPDRANGIAFRRAFIQEHFQ